MTAPLCLHCQQRPVRKCAPCVAHRRGREPRIVGGVHWNYFCGRRCGTKASIQKANRTRLENRQRGHVDRLVALVKPHMDADGKVDAKLFVREVATALKREYNRGYNRAIWRWCYSEQVSA